MHPKLPIPGGASVLASLLGLLLVALPCPAADRITATVAVTNAAGTTNGQTITIAAGATTIRTWTNSVSIASSQILTNATAAGAATNLYNQLAGTAPVGVAPIVMTTATNVVLYGQSGIPLVLTLSDGWGTVSYSTQTVTTAVNVRVPQTVETAAQRTNIASALVDWINYDGATNQIEQSTPAAAQLVGLTNAQTITGNKFFQNTNTHMSIVVSNVTVTNAATIASLTVTNLTALNSASVSNLSVAGYITFSGSVSKFFADADKFDFMPDTTDGWVAFGYISSLPHSFLGAHGVFTNDVRAGAGFFTNSIYATGTNTFPAGGDVAFGRYANSSLANGNNAAVLVGTNVFVEVSGPTAAFAINGINGSPNRDGKLVILLNRTTYDMTIANDSGVDPTAGNRIYTSTGADRATTGNGAAILIYSGSAARWILISFDP